MSTNALKSLIYPFRRQQPGGDNLSEVWLAIEQILSTRATNTKRAYRAIIKELCKFLKVEPGTEEAAKAWADVTINKAYQFLTYTSNQPGQPHRITGNTNPATNTVIRKIIILRSIYGKLKIRGIFNHNPFAAIELPHQHRGEKRPTEQVPFNQVIPLINSNSGSNKDRICDRALLSIMFGAALRRSEVINLKMGDIKFDESGRIYLYLRETKSGKDEAQGVADFAQEQIKALYDQRKAEGAKSSDPFLCNYRGNDKSPGRKLSDKTLYRRFKRAACAVGLPGSITPHSARATAITKLLTDGASYREVQDFARHSSIQMVEVYDKRQKSIIQTAAKKLNF